MINNKIECLVGELLTDICFVRDYLQFGFSGLKLNCYTAPRILLDNEEFLFPERGSRDALCAFIGQAIIATEIIDNIRLTVSFRLGKINIPLDSESRQFGDAAELISGGDQPTIIF